MTKKFRKKRIELVLDINMGFGRANCIAQAIHRAVEIAFEFAPILFALILVSGEPHLQVGVLRFEGNFFSGKRCPQFCIGIF